MKENDALTERIIGCCFKVHLRLGPGLPERIYQNSLHLEFGQSGLVSIAEKEFSVYYQDKKVGHLRIDLIVEHKVIVEIKALTTHLPQVFSYQVLTYLRVSNLKVGLLVNFGSKSCEVKRLSL